MTWSCKAGGDADNVLIVGTHAYLEAWWAV